MNKQRYIWKKEYTTVLVVNALYIFIFYVLMEIFN